MPEDNICTACSVFRDHLQMFYMFNGFNPLHNFGVCMSNFVQYRWSDKINALRWCVCVNVCVLCNINMHTLPLSSNKSFQSFALIFMDIQNFMYANNVDARVKKRHYIYKKVFPVSVDSDNTRFKIHVHGLYNQRVMPATFTSTAHAESSQRANKIYLKSKHIADILSNVAKNLPMNTGNAVSKAYYENKNKIKQKQNRKKNCCAGI